METTENVRETTSSVKLNHVNTFKTKANDKEPTSSAQVSLGFQGPYSWGPRPLKDPILRSLEA